MNHVLIAIPAHNEAKSIGKVIFSSLKNGNVIVVDDYSSDDTRKIAVKHRAHVISNSKKLGYDNSLNIAYQYALSKKYRILVTIDADGQLPTQKIPEFVNKIESGIDLVIGYRNKYPRLTEYLFSKICNVMTSIKDPYCGMKAYNLSKCFKFKKFDRYNSVGTDLMLTLALKNYIIENIFINVEKRSGISRFGGKIISEFKLFPALVIGILRIILTKQYLKR